MRSISVLSVLSLLLMGCGGLEGEGANDPSGAYQGVMIFNLSGADCPSDSSSFEDSVSAVLVQQADGKYLLSLDAGLSGGTFTMVRSGDHVESETPFRQEARATEKTASAILNPVRDELNLTVTTTDLDRDCTTVGAGALRRSGGGADAGT